MRPQPASSTPPCCPSASGSSAPTTLTPDHPGRPRPLEGESRSWLKLRSTAAQRLHPENSSPGTAPRYSNGHAFRRITGDLCGLPNSC
jgi:hypothetical protein